MQNYKNQNIHIQNILVLDGIGRPVVCYQMAYIIIKWIYSKQVVYFLKLQKIDHYFQEEMKQIRYKELIKF